jgi:hypothetical protein
MILFVMQIHNFLGDIPFSFGGACVVYFVIEAPLMVVLKQVFRKPAKKTGKCSDFKFQQTVLK